ncbi:MAG: exo-alpha-sialidase [Planctomycetaceae bacterium]|nr:exo-alpha-sialidase [Planctomycetaceae bacterium]
MLFRYSTLGLPAALLFCLFQGAVADDAGLSSELVFPLHNKHNHAPGIVECPNGDFLISWFRGSGERQSDDVAIYGARLKKGASEWSEPFLMADHPDFPDCNTCMMIDREGRLWLFWPIILANTWESCLTRFKVSSDYQGEGPPVWDRVDTMFLKPDDFSGEATVLLEQMLKDSQLRLSEQQENYFNSLRDRLNDKLFQRLGWQPRCKPTVLPSGRILLPLYSDTYSFGLMAISDDDGANWYASKPLMGFGGIQPAVVRRDDGTLVAYMRENGPRRKIRVSESTDDGVTWGPVGVIDLPSPGSGLDAVRLENGHWALIYNDLTRGRNSLAVSISDDEGKTWKWTRHLEQHDSGSYHYPAIIQGADGTIHAIYSYFVEGGKSMKHAAFTEDWVRGE